MRIRAPRPAAASIVLALVVGCTSSIEAQAAYVPSAFRAGAAVDANRLGDALVAWNGPTGVRAVLGDRQGGFTPVWQLSAAKDTWGSPQAAVDERGDAIVVWETYQESGGGECSTCEPRLVSTGVWAALRRPASGFGPAIALAGPQPDTGAGYGLAEPQLAMSSSGAAVVAWSGAGGAMAAFRSPGGEIGAPQRVPAAGFAVRSAAIAGDGQAFLADGTGRVCVRPAGGTFGAPELLPGSRGPYGPGALLAANAAGDALAAYPGTRGVEVSRRPAGGGWSAPALLTAVGGASERAVTIADSGVGAVAFVQIDRDPQRGGRASLLVATFGPDLVPSSEQVNAAGFDADMADGLDMDDAGNTAVTFDRSTGLLDPGVAQLAFRPPTGPYATVGTLTSPQARHHADGDGADVAFGPDGEMLATWVDHHPGQDRLTARWIGQAGVGPPMTLDSAAARDFVLPPIPTGHAAQLTTQPHRRPDRHGRILVGLRCLSIDRRPCNGTLKLTAGSPKWTAGRKRFAIAPGVAKRIRVTLTRRARSALRRRGRITLTARAVTTASGGTFGATTGRIVVKR